MAAATDPVFTDTPKTWAKALSASADGTPATRAPTNTVTLITGPADGAKVDLIVYQTYETALDPGVINLWLHDGSTHFLVDQVKILGTDGSTTAPGERAERSYPCLLVINGWTLQVSTTVASQVIDVTAFGGEF